MKQLPIVIDGKTLGQLTICREGAYVVCRGHAEWSGELLRLWLYGEAAPLYVGVVQPDGTVRKRFSLGEFGRSGSFTHCGNRPPAAEETHEERDVVWYRQTDGTLRRRGYLAFPAKGVRLPKGYTGLRRVIEGEEYVIFPG